MDTFQVRHFIHCTQTHIYKNIHTYTCTHTRTHARTHTHTQHNTMYCTPFYRLTPSLGATQDVPASSCKEIRQSHTGNGYQPPTDGMYWITIQDQCTNQTQTIKVTCYNTSQNVHYNLHPLSLSYTTTGLV